MIDVKIKDTLDSNRIECAQKQKQEYHLIGSYFRTKGLTLFAYDSINDDLYQLNVVYSNTITCIPTSEGLIAVDMEAQKCMIDSRHIVFEALNFKTAKERLCKFKQGKISELCNLRKPNPNALKLN